MKGSCLCGAVKYEIQPPFKAFQYCHCSRCRKITGSAHAASIYVSPEQFKWAQGESSVGRYEVADAKYYATSFCKKCGANLPWLVQGGRTVVVPAGSLDEHPDALPSQSIYWASRASWFIETGDLAKHDALPKKNNE